MVNSLTLNPDTKNLRNVVLSILADNHPLSARKIYEMTKSGYIQNVTYPAVYKTLKVMVREGKLVKQRREFSININWIQSLKKFVEDVELTHAGKQRLPKLEDTQKENYSGTFFFNNYEEADNFRKEIQWTYLKEKRKNPYCGSYKHFKTPVIYSQKSVYEVRHLKAKKITTFLAVSGNTAIDRWCAKIYRNNPNVNTKTGLNIPSVETCETMILGDVIVQIFIPENIRKITETIYNKTKTIDDVDTIEFYEKIYKTAAKVKIVVFNNPQMADMLRNQIIGYFKKQT